MRHPPESRQGMPEPVKPDREECSRCGGCRQIAVTADGTPTEDGAPWSAWAELPVESLLAVQLGLVRPAPCPKCTPDPEAAP